MNESRKLIAKISEAERDEIRSLYERKGSLIELFKTFDGEDNEQSNKLFNKVVNELSVTSRAYNEWFASKSIEHNWENIPGASWQIDFNTCDVYLEGISN